MHNHGQPPLPQPPMPNRHKPRSTGKTVAIVLLTIWALFATAWGCAATLAAGVSTTAPASSLATKSLKTSTTSPETDEPTTAAPAVPTKRDLKVGIKELERSCFGSAGCNITFRMRVTLVNPEKFASGTTYEVSYRISGGSEAKTGTFTLTDGSAMVSESDLISTPPNPTLKATVTEVEARL